MHPVRRAGFFYLLGIIRCCLFCTFDSLPLPRDSHLHFISSFVRHYTWHDFNHIYRTNPVHYHFIFLSCHRFIFRLLSVIISPSPLSARSHSWAFCMNGYVLCWCSLHKVAYGCLFSLYLYTCLRYIGLCTVLY